MIPSQLQPESFKAYPSLARVFATKHLALLRQMPLSICPSFLTQIAVLDTRFPVERETLEWQCTALESMENSQRVALLGSLYEIKLPSELARMDWVASPNFFVEKLTSILWSTGQIDRFHAAVRALFASIPEQIDTTDRLLLIVLGRDADVSKPSFLRKLARQGLRLEAIDSLTAESQIITEFTERARQSPQTYRHWYIDGGEPWNISANQQDKVAIKISYPELAPLRKQVLSEVATLLKSGQGGAERMRTALSEISPNALGSERVTDDLILQRFYTELFTGGSGTQIFSTSFVQWTGRELAKRTQPKTLLLRYAPRQRHRGLNEMVENSAAATTTDPEGSLVDAEMDAFYNWIAMNRISAKDRLTTLAWAEGSSRAVLIGPKTKPNTISHQHLTIAQALRAMRSA